MRKDRIMKRLILCFAIVFVATTSGVNTKRLFNKPNLRKLDRKTPDTFFHPKLERYFDNLPPKRKLIPIPWYDSVDPDRLKDIA
tara:strand:+ start:1036 stop:1287 length:252 start_codon:yes stop_codon:yes gene_type:complete